MVFEGADGSLGGVTAVDMGRDELECASIVRDGLLVRRTGFIVEYVDVDVLFSRVEHTHDRLVGRNAVGIGF